MEQPVAPPQPVQPVPTPQVAMPTTPPPTPAVPKKKNLKPLFFGLFLVIFIIIASVGGYAYYQATNTPAQPDTSDTTNPNTESPDMVACTMDAKICPDGSSVGRVGPNCEFEACPTTGASDQTTQMMKTHTDASVGFSITYPTNKLVACGYDGNELLLWLMPFPCPDGHDVPYAIDIRTIEAKDFQAIKAPSKTETVTVAGKEATQYTYSFEEEDGQLFELKEKTEITIPIDTKVITLSVYGTGEKKQLFMDMLKTATFSAAMTP